MTIDEMTNIVWQSERVRGNSGLTGIRFRRFRHRVVSVEILRVYP